MSNPIVKIKTGNISNLYANNEHISNSNHLEPLEHGELAYNKNNNGLYIGYNGKNYLISAAFSDVENPSQNNDYQYFHGLADSAKNANVAVKLGTVDKGDSNTPIWLDNGEPKEVTGLDLDTTGNAATATQWKTARNFSISGTASDTTTFSVNGTKNITLALPKTLSGFTSLSAGTFTGGVWNGTTIAVAYGGTGMTTNPSMLVNLGSTTADTVFKTSPRPGITGTLSVDHGGTGVTTFTSGEVLIGAGTNAVTTRAITNNTTTGSSITASTNLITANTLANWNGAYDGNGNSRITKLGTVSKGVWNGTTVAVAYGGTGNTAQTKNRLIYSEEANKLSSSGHYANSTKVAINSTTAPTEALYVNGNFKTYGNAYVDNGFISITRDGNPYIGLSDGANNWYYQSVKGDNKVGLGPTWVSATKWDTSGNMYMPAKIEVTGEATFLGTIKASKIIPRETMNTAYLLGDAVNTWYNIYSRSLQIYDGTNKSDGGKIYTAVSAATTANATVAELGNSIKTGTANNRYGVLRLYSEGATYLNLAAYRYATNSATTEATARTIYLRDHGATAYLAATTTRSAVGSNVQPVYVTNSGVLTACKMPASGAWFNALPVIGSDGVVEIGRYIDFHSTNATTSDYSVRIDAGTGSQGNVLYLPDITGQVVIHTNNTAEGSASLPVYIAASGKATACTAGSVFSNFSSTAGTTKGETLSITVATKTRTLVLDHATDSQSGVVTTGAQTFAGNKTLYGNFIVTNSDSTSTTERSVRATTANGSVGIYQSTNRGLYDFTQGNWIIFSNAGNSNAITIPSRLHVPYLTITSTSSGEHIKFSKAGYNYITYPSGGTVAINCGSSLGEGYAQLLINESSVRSGTGASLGTSGDRWSYVYGRNFHAKNLSNSASTASFTVENYDGSASISLLYGSGQSNVGLYDNVTDAWILYRPLASDDAMSRKTTRFNHGVAFTGSHGTGNPGTSTNGYGVTGAVYFKRV